MLVGSWGIFQLGELAAAGTTQSLVVSVLRALHEDGFQKKTSGKGRKREQEGERAEVFLDVLEAPQGHLVKTACAGEQGESSWEKVGGRCAGRESVQNRSQKLNCFSPSLLLL